MTDYNDDLLQASREQNLLVKFRSSLDSTKGDVVQKRRAFLATLLGTAGLAVTESIASAASAEASTIETNGSAGGAAMQLQAEVHRIAREHMQPNADPNKLLSDSLSAWRDARMLRSTHLATSRLNHNVCEVESIAAGLVAQFLGDRGKLPEAESWYHSALKIAPSDDTRAWLYGCRTWLYLYAGDEAGAKRNAAKSAGLATFFNHDRAAFGYHQLARSYALGGELDKAREHLSNATNHFLYSRGSTEPAAPASLLGWTVIQNAQYSMDTLAILAYDGDNKRDVGRFAVNAELVDDKIDELNGMNAFLGRMSMARIKASGPNADADAAVEMGMNAISNLSSYDRRTSVVQGRSQQFADDLELKFGNVKSVRAMRGFVGELAKAA